MPISCGSPISTPKSPRATITPSAASISSCRLASLATTSARSILAIILASLPALVNASRTGSKSEPRQGKETATNSRLFSIMHCKSSKSFSVIASAAKPPPSRLIPLRELNGPACVTSQTTSVVLVLLTNKRIRPSSSSKISSAWTDVGSGS